MPGVSKRTGRGETVAREDPQTATETTGTGAPVRLCGTVGWPLMATNAVQRPCSSALRITGKSGPASELGMKQGATVRRFFWGSTTRRQIGPGCSLKAPPTLPGRIEGGRTKGGRI